jgi:hypothetical protein
LLIFIFFRKNINKTLATTGNISYNTRVYALKTHSAITRGIDYMSASDKKKLRKEQNVAAMTEKQQTANKEQKKLKAYTFTFVIAMILVVAIFLVAVLKAPVTNLLMNATNAVTIGEHKIDAAEFNYFYIDAIGKFYGNFSDYGEYKDMYVQMFTGLNPSAELGSQVYDEKTGETWADYFAKAAVENAKWTYAMYDKAMAAGHQLSAEEKSTLANVEAYMDLYAAMSQMSSADSYIKSMYGSSANMDSYLAYYERNLIAQSFAGNYINGLEYKDEDYRNHEKDKFHEYCSYSYATIVLNVNDYLTGGTKVTGEDGKTTITYSDEEKKAAQEAALADAKKLLASNANNVENLNLAIAALKKDDKNKEATEITGRLHSALSINNEDMKKWVVSDERKAGDLNYFENTTSDDKKTVTGYTVVLYLERIDNTMNVGTVRHLLVKFEGGTTDKTTNKTTYSDAEKKKAKEEAEKLLAEFNKGDKTEKAFIELLKKHSDDKDSSGKVNNEGLYENVTPDSGYVKSFTEWATAEHKAGDVGIIETEYGYHIMYYVEANELNYRDMLIRNDLVEKDFTAWEKSVIDSVTATMDNMIFLNKDYILSAGN